MVLTKMYLNMEIDKKRGTRNIERVSTDNMPRRRLPDLNVIQIPPNSEETNTENGGRRKTRGRTLLKDLYNLNSVEHVKVSRNSQGQPIGSEARVLAGYLGIIARNVNLLPINYESWHHMPDSNKNHALDNIKERFVLEVSDNYVKKALAKKWRDHKCTLKKEYIKKNISLEEKLQNVSPRMLRY
ncbi:Myosin tail region-interacting MTI1 [Gossypium arboreum]|uniref:Myosin tail region-interacting MTI1 n=1 Tax=Gossypium arboreum TaxID=29729 RepID=A0A0B0P788_GOSAR|nr:Myosin tail region-interacting MTI1 [Gossypium arboreum]